MDALQAMIVSFTAALPLLQKLCYNYIWAKKQKQKKPNNTITCIMSIAAR